MSTNVTTVDYRSIVARAEDERVEEEEEHLDFFHLFWIYTLASVIGLFVETAVSYPIDGVWKDRAGLLWGPFSPIYGVGALIMTVFLHRLRHANPMTLFFAAALLGASFEYAAGAFWEAMFGFVAWDYSDQPLNLGGHTCAGIAVVWGLLGMIYIRDIMPPVMRLIDCIPEGVRAPLTAAAFALTMVDVAATICAFQCWFDRTAGLAPATDLQRYFAAHYGDAYMAYRFQTIHVHPELSMR